MKKIMFLLILSTMLIIPINTAFADKDTAKAICVMNADTGDVVYEKNSSERLPMASTTKIMTAYVALKNSTMPELVIPSINAQYQEGSAMYIPAGISWHMEDLLYGLMLNSGNDAAVAIAEHICGTVDGFVELMNKTARDLGADNTAFKNPNGLPADGHYTTAYDLALITSEALKIDDFRTVVSTAHRTAWAVSESSVVRELYNHNKLLGTYEGAIGVKTGYTDLAGRCLVSAAQRNGMTFIVVTLNDNDDWNTHKELLDEMFGTYELHTWMESGKCVKRVERNGVIYDLVTEDAFTLPMRNDRKEDVVANVHITANADSAIAAGHKVGRVEFTLDGKSVGEVAVVAKEDIPEPIKREFKDIIAEFWKKIIGFLI